MDIIFETKKIVQTLDKRSRVGIYIIRDKKIYVGSGNSDFKYKYIIPGGGIEPGETLEIAAIRESKEEIGVIPKNIKIIEHKNNPYLKCGLLQYGFKYNCSELYYCYGQFEKFDNSIIEDYNGFVSEPILLNYNSMKNWLSWAIDITVKEIPRNFKYRSDLEMLNYLKDNNLI